jgi:tRNA-specific 2-thiouridylase
MKKKVYLAMSGGVDSSVAAALLKEQGYFVIGVFMKFWSPNIRGQSPAGTVPLSAVPLSGSLNDCLWQKEREDALRVASILDIPLLTWDFTKEYEKKVVGYMLKAYKNGLTPNPDVMCNKEIKFGLFFNRAIAEGADLIATGHYARIIKLKAQNSKLKTKEFELFKAKDLNKDQSYFLYILKQKHLARTLFPIGEYTKPEVRKLARKFGLPTAEKKDSQGICFVGPLKVRDFLKEYIKPKRGLIVLRGQNSGFRDWKSENRELKTDHEVVLGEHDGVCYYTIGQRHGMDIKTGGGPYFVVGKDIKSNILYVGREKDLYLKEAIVSDLQWINGQPRMPARVAVKVRYRSQVVPATVSKIVEPLTDQKIKVDFSQPLRAVTSGQAAVIYKDDHVLGGGILK